jgi:hypothetical protein
VSVGLWKIDPAAYARHSLHSGDRVWPEANCYVDLWVELLHTAGANPVAALPFTFAVDVEGDQWTFFKFPLADLQALYGVDVFELNVWRPLATHVEEQIALGRAAIVEVDAFYLPDTSGTSYGAEHVKTSIGIQSIDTGCRRLGYFHNASYCELAGDDFAGVFRLEGHLTDPEYLPPYVEVIKLDRLTRPSERQLIQSSLELLRAHLRRRPIENPFWRYAARFSHDMEWLAGEPLSCFHNYAFATLRQCGAAFELAGAYLRWLEAGGEPGLACAAERCELIAVSAKTLQFKTARAVAGKPSDPAPLLEAMAVAWDDAMTALTGRYAS